MSKAAANVLVVCPYVVVFTAGSLALGGILRNGIVGWREIYRYMFPSNRYRYIPFPSKGCITSHIHQ